MIWWNELQRRRWILTSKHQHHLLLTLHINIEHIYSKALEYKFVENEMELLTAYNWQATFWNDIFYSFLCRSTTFNRRNFFSISLFEICQSLISLFSLKFNDRLLSIWTIIRWNWVLFNERTRIRSKTLENTKTMKWNNIVRFHVFFF